ncbi:MAG: DUF6129 family protein [Candidatus Thiodiazotropha sp.]
MISQRQLEQISQMAGAQPVSEVMVEQLRSNFPDIHFTYCMDDDVVAARPVHEEAAFNLYLIDSRNHCLCFTQDMQVATGVVLAEIDDDAE